MYTYTYIYTCVYIYVYVYIHIYKCIYTYMHTYIYIYTHTYIHIHVYIYIYTRIHMYIFIYLFILSVSPKTCQKNVFSNHYHHLKGQRITSPPPISSSQGTELCGARITPYEPPLFFYYRCRAKRLASNFIFWSVPHGMAMEAIVYTYLPCILLWSFHIRVTRLISSNTCVGVWNVFVLLVLTDLLIWSCHYMPEHSKWTICTVGVQFSGSDCLWPKLTVPRPCSSVPLSTENKWTGWARQRPVHGSTLFHLIWRPPCSTSILFHSISRRKISFDWNVSCKALSLACQRASPHQILTSIVDPNSSISQPLLSLPLIPLQYLRPAKLCHTRCFMSTPSLTRN